MASSMLVGVQNGASVASFPVLTFPVQPVFNHGISKAKRSNIMNAVSSASKRGKGPMKPRAATKKNVSALKTIRVAQRQTHQYFPFSRVRAKMIDWLVTNNRDMRLAERSVNLLGEAVQDQMVKMLEDANNLTLHRGCLTVMSKDAKRLKMLKPEFITFKQI